MWGGGESFKIMFPGGTSYSLIRKLLLYDVPLSRNTRNHRQMDRQTDNIIMAIANHTAWQYQYDWLMKTANEIKIVERVRI